MQAWTLKDYPAEFMITTLCCGIVVIISTIVAFIAEGNTKAWILRPDIELVTIVYSVSTDYRRNYIMLNSNFGPTFTCSFSFTVLVMQFWYICRPFSSYH